MDFQDFLKLYEKKKLKYGDETYKHISELLTEAKELHKKGWGKSPSPKGDYGQSWKPFKGKSLEKLIAHIIKEQVETLGLKIVDGNKLEKTMSIHLSKELNQVKRNLLVDFGEFGEHLPDVDIVIYNPTDSKVIAVISSKVTLRERIAQTGYWKIKLGQDELTKGIKVFFITPDEDKTLTVKNPAKKGRAIVEVDTDGSYVMSEEEIVESGKVKKFDKFAKDLENLIYAKKGK